MLDCKRVDGQHPRAKLLIPEGTVSKEIPSMYALVC